MMNRFKPTALALLGTLVLSGCNTQPTITSQTANASPEVVEGARFMQMRDPISNYVALEMGLPHPNGCSRIVQKSKTSTREKVRKASQLLSCSADTAAPNLPYKAVIRNTMFNYPMNIHALTQTMCQKYVEGMMSKKTDLLVLETPCQKKTG